MAQSNQPELRMKNFEETLEKWKTITDKKGQANESPLQKSFAGFSKVIAESGTETERLGRAKTMYLTFKEDGTLADVPAEFLGEISPYFESDTSAKGQQKDDLKSGPKSAKAGPHITVRSVTQMYENQAVDAGTAADSSLHPTPSSQSGQPVRDQGTQRTADLENEIKCLKKELDDEHEGRLKQIKEKEKEIREEMAEKEKEMETNVAEEKKKYENVKKELDDKQKLNESFEKQLNSQELVFNNQIEEMAEEIEKMRKEKYRMHREIETMANEKRKNEGYVQKLITERDDLRDRFSKLAGEKLSDQNADIADLSDPNRAMKLSERFGQLYDDEWTNAFESLTDKNIDLSLNDAIHFLLRALQDCLLFCNMLKESQMASLRNVFLHPAQDDMTKYAAEPRQHDDGIKNTPTIDSKDEKPLRELRRRVGASGNIIEEVQQAFLLKTKSWEEEKKGYDKKHIEACTPYLQKCAEICWLMVLHDPPLYMKMEVKPDDKLDPNIYTVYSTTGDKIDYLVWPPLYNGKDGGLLSKGVAEPKRTVKTEPQIMDIEK